MKLTDMFVTEETDEKSEEELMFMTKKAYGHIDRAFHELDGATLLLDPSDSRVEDYKAVEAKIKQLMILMRSMFDITE